MPPRRRRLGGYDTNQADHHQRCQRAQNAALDQTHHDHPLTFRLASALRDLTGVPYRFRAFFSHVPRRLRDCLRHAFSALESFCALVNDLGLAFTVGGTEPGAMLPTPKNVALGAAPKIDGCGVGAALHESPVEHAGGETTPFAKHGTAAVHSCAS